MSLLKQTEERWWLGQSHWVLGLNYAQIGEFEPALQSEAGAHSIGEAIGDLRLQSYAAWTTGGIHAMRGESEAGIDACKRGLECSPDPVNTAVALGWLGYAYFEKGEPAEAIPLLEQSVQQMHRFGYRQVEGWFLTFLSEASLINGNIEKARDLARQALEISREVKFEVAIGWAQRALGRIARASGDFLAAETHFNDALETFSSIQTRFEEGRTRFALAELSSQWQGGEERHELALAHLKEAQALFKTLQVPRYVERTEELAKNLSEKLL